MRSLLFFILLSFFFVSSAQEKDEFQIWNFNTISARLSEGFNIEIAEKIQHTTISNSLILKFGDIWLKHRINPYFQYGAGFRLLYMKKELLWQEEKRPMIIANFSKRIIFSRISLSNRLEYRAFKELKNHLRYRGLLNIDLPPILKNMNFYISEEAYYKLDSDMLHMMRFYAGIRTVINQNCEVKIYYVLDKSKNLEIWENSDVLGLNIRFEIK